MAIHSTAPPPVRDELIVSYVGGKQTANRTDALPEFRRSGAGALLQQILTGLGARDVHITKVFNRTTDLKPVSGILPDAHGVRVRLKPAGQDRGYLVVVLARPAETVAELCRRVEAGAARVLGHAPPRVTPEDPLVVDRVVELVDAIDYHPEFGATLPDFADAVAAEAGPGEDAGFWFRALLAAEQRGRLLRNGVCFYRPAYPDDEGAGTTIEGSSGPELPPVTSAPAPPPVQPTSSSPPPAAAIDLLAENATSFIEALVEVRAAHADRRAVLDRVAEIRENLTRAEAEACRDLAAVEARLAAAQARVNPDLLLLLADVARPVS